MNTEIPVFSTFGRSSPRPRGKSKLIELMRRAEQSHRETWGEQRSQLQGNGRKRRKQWA